MRPELTNVAVSIVLERAKAAQVSSVSNQVPPFTPQDVWCGAPSKLPIQNITSESRRVVAKHERDFIQRRALP